MRVVHHPLRRDKQPIAAGLERPPVSAAAWRRTPYVGLLSALCTIATLTTPHKTLYQYIGD